MYEGGYVNGKREGNGTEHYSNGNLKFKGEFKNDGYHGKNVTIYNIQEIQQSSAAIIFQGDVDKGSYVRGRLFHPNGR